ncbi:putative fatty acyl-CoA reductase CG5065 [Zerene cesonia]|uniref:putative fatty acyl-CoA reductase CG5065 n=1 Tax=Zerene cesonia TaxID=33412 RepID=UPI0018E5417B|nr:putative fatty acyl-CoA reductase CG5065 [Zerene cesonia]
MSDSQQDAVTYRLNSTVKLAEPSAVPDNKYIRVADYYAGKSVFITGATGFLGKLFVERLLYNCKDIEAIYILIRSKKGEGVERRLQNIFDVPIFDKLKEVRPNDLKKVIAIEGDVTSPRLGIKDEDEQKLIDQVSVVFHSAATVRFADPFRTTMAVNFEGTKKVMDLAKSMKKLETFAYLSTAFSNAPKIAIDEKIYPPIKNLDEVTQFIEHHGTDEARIEEFKGHHPNIYALSKLLSEHLVNEYRGKMPSIIIRPSVVGPILHEPLKGWTDNWVASTATFSNAARGLMSMQYGSRDTVCDLIPVDYVTNFSLVAAARGNKTDEVLVYNICSSSQNPISWRYASDLFLEESRKHGYCIQKNTSVLYTSGTY